MFQKQWNNSEVHVAQGIITVALNHPVSTEVDKYHYFCFILLPEIDMH